jgi:hypothetical protein
VSDSPSALTRLMKGFGRFWWDFLVGDTPELFVAALVIIGVTALLSEVGHFNVAAMIALPVLAVLALAATLWRARRFSRER